MNPLGRVVVVVVVLIEPGTCPDQGPPYVDGPVCCGRSPTRSNVEEGSERVGHLPLSTNDGVVETKGTGSEGLR